MTESIADAILDWVDEDNDPRPFGAEAEAYQQMDSPYTPSNLPLKQIDELLCIRGVTPKLLYGADTNRNGVIDGGEDNSLENALGWAGLIRARSSQSAVHPATAQSDVDQVLFALSPDNSRVDQFSELDTDRDGRLSLAEFGAGRKPSYAAKWFGLRDVDQDGALSLSEFAPQSALSVADTQPSRSAAKVAVAELTEEPADTVHPSAAAPNQPDIEHIYWSDRNDDHWVTGMKVIRWPTSVDRRLVVEFVLRNDAPETRQIELDLYCGTKSSLSISQGNQADVDFKETRHYKQTTAAGKVMRFDEGLAEISFKGL
jgi:hypothetical protein